MKIGFAGAGKVGKAFGLYLVKNGYEVCGYYSLHKKDSEEAAFLTASKSFSSPELLLAAADTVFITTPDDKIREVCEMLCDIGINEKYLFIHMSGSLSSEILDKAYAKGASVATLHPLQAFADEQKAVRELPETYFTAEGHGRRWQDVIKILLRTGNPALEIDGSKKELYHASACVFSNYLVTLFDLATALAGEAGISRPDCLKAMMPLIKGTISNMEYMEASKALTGPVARGDAGTIQKHLDAMEEYLPERKAFYSNLVKETIKIASVEKVTDPEKIKNLYEVLEGRQ